VNKKTAVTMDFSLALQNLLRRRSLLNSGGSYVGSGSVLVGIPFSQSVYT